MTDVFLGATVTSGLDGAGAGGSPILNPTYANDGDISTAVGFQSGGAGGTPAPRWWIVIDTVAPVALSGFLTRASGSLGASLEGGLVTAKTPSPPNQYVRFQYSNDDTGDEGSYIDIDVTKTSDDGTSPTTQTWTFNAGSIVSRYWRFLKAGKDNTNIWGGLGLYRWEAVETDPVFDGLDVDFVGVPRLGIAPLAVQFTPLVSNAPDNAGYLWTFGDGTTSTEYAPLHVYNNVGLYTVSLTVNAGDIITPPPPPPVTGDAPAVPGGYGTTYLRDFSDNSLGEFQIFTYPNDHPGDLMIQYGLFDAGQVSVHDGYLDLRATRQMDDTWLMGFVGTFTVGGSPTPTFDFQYGTARVMARMNTGRGAWQGAWYLISDSWGAPEIDWPEMIGGHYTANLHGSSSNGQKASVAAFDASEWHEYGIVKDPAYIAFLLDGVEIARASVAMSANMALMADAKVGLTAPDSTTPDELYLHIAWWAVD